MSLAREIVRLARELPQRLPTLDLFDHPQSTALLRSDMGVVALAERVQARIAGEPVLFIKLVAQALQLQRRELEPKIVDASFVATLPGLLPMGTFGTAQAISDMLSSPSREVIALGYEISSSTFLSRLRELAAAGRRIVLLYDADQTDDAALRAGWPPHADVSFYAGRVDGAKAPYAKMHGKALLVDGEDLLVTSANLTYHGLEGNIELGVRLRGAAASDARRILEHIARCGAFERRPAL